MSTTYTDEDFEAEMAPRLKQSRDDMQARKAAWRALLTAHEDGKK